jgi:hypothetical protein
MEITRQLYELQEVDTEIERDEASLASNTARLGDRSMLDAAREKLAAGQKNLEDLKRQRRDAERQVDDVSSKIAVAKDQLYSGRTSNPKELTNLQHEINTLKAHNDQLETKALEIIEQAEDAEKVIAAAIAEYGRLETEWQEQQKRLGIEIEQLNGRLAGSKEQRQQTAGQIDTPTLALYDKLRKHKKQAVSRVAQGICSACHISQSASALQKARGGQPVQCGSCGRILFIS